MSSHYESKNILYIKTGAVTQKQAERAFGALMRDVIRSKKFRDIAESDEFKAVNDGQPFDRLNYRVNVVRTSWDVPLGKAYAWVEDVRIANMLRGLNPDGSRRVVKVDDDTWVAPAKSEEEAYDEAKSALEAEIKTLKSEVSSYDFVGICKSDLKSPLHDSKKSWADMDDESQKLEVLEAKLEALRRDISKRYIRPKKEAPAKPWINVPCVEYNEEQKALLRSTLIREAMSRHESLESVNTVVLRGTFKVSEAYIYLPDSKESDSRKLVCVITPHWVIQKLDRGENPLRPYFDYLNTDDKEYVDRKTQRRFKYPTYSHRERPTKNGNYVIFITYSGLYDAPAALLMNRYVDLVNPATGETSKLIFDHYKYQTPPPS